MMICKMLMNKLSVSLRTEDNKQSQVYSTRNGACRGTICHFDLRPPFQPLFMRNFLTLLTHMLQGGPAVLENRRLYIRNKDFPPMVLYIFGHDGIYFHTFHRKGSRDGIRLNRNQLCSATLVITVGLINTSKQHD